MVYTFRDDIAIADVAFEASGKTLEEMLEAAALATTVTMVKELNSVAQKIERIFEVDAANLEQLLHDFLQELIYFKDAELLLFSKYTLKIGKRGTNYILKAACTGEELNMKKHELLVDVKAVSWHMFRAWKDKDSGEYKCLVILDV